MLPGHISSIASANLFQARKIGECAGRIQHALWPRVFECASNLIGNPAADGLPFCLGGLSGPIFEVVRQIDSDLCHILYSILGHLAPTDKYRCAISNP